MSQVIFVINQSHGDPPTVLALVRVNWQVDRGREGEEWPAGVVIKLEFFNPEHESVITSISFLFSFEIWVKAVLEIKLLYFFPPFLSFHPLPCTLFSQKSYARYN